MLAKEVKPLQLNNIFHCVCESVICAYLWNVMGSNTSGEQLISKHQTFIHFLFLRVSPCKIINYCFVTIKKKSRIRTYLIMETVCF